MAEVSRILGKGKRLESISAKINNAPKHLRKDILGGKASCHYVSCHTEGHVIRTQQNPVPIGRRGGELAMFTNVLPPYQEQQNSISSIFQLFFLLHIPSPRHTCKYCTALSTLKQMLPLSFFCHLLFKYVQLYAAYTYFVVVPCKIKATHRKCFIFTMLPAKSCSVKRIKQMADLNVKDREGSMKES